MNSMLDFLHVITSGAAGTAAVLCVYCHVTRIGWWSGKIDLDRFGWESTKASVGLTAGMILTAMISWVVQDCERTAMALLLANLRETIFAVTLFSWAWFIDSLSRSTK